jgi:hypothetical protein
VSEEEQLAAIGRAVKEYGETKARFTALMSEISRASGALAGVAEQLKRIPYQAAPGLYSNIDSIPTADRVRKLVEDMEIAYRRRGELANSLRGFGVEPKD